MKAGTKRKIFTVIFVLTLIFIFGHSLMPGEASSTESGAVFEFLAPLFRIFLPERLVTDHLVRKLAHFSEYALLGLETGLHFGGSGAQESIYRRSTRLGIGLFSAFIDETIQTFVSGRSGEVRDMWIDFFGFITGLLIAALLKKLFHKRMRGNGNGLEKALP